MIDNAFLGDFRGLELNPIQLDGLLAYSLSPADIGTARSLINRRWWDYRRLHPGHAFFLFAHHYGQISESWRSKFGLSIHARLKSSDHPIWRTERIGREKHFTLSPQMYRTGLWRAMCHADEFAMPYERWIEMTFQSAFDNRVERMPAPNNLYTPYVIQGVTARFEEERDALMTLPKDPFYLMENFSGDPLQIEFQAWLCKIILKRPSPHIALKHYLTMEPMLDLDVTKQIVGEAIFNRALTL